MMMLFPVSGDTEPVLVANVMDGPAILGQKETPCETRFYGRFILSFGEKLDEMETQLEQAYTQSTMKPTDAFQLVSDFIRSRSAERASLQIGIEGRHFPSVAKDMLSKKHPRIAFGDIDGTLQQVRMVKTAEEVERIRQSSAINVKAFRAVVEEIRPGVTEIQLMQTYMAEIAKHKATPAFSMIAAGNKSAVIFPTYEKTGRVKKNDTVRLDVGCEYKGYCSDVSRTVEVGNVSAEKKRILRATTHGYTETIKSLRPGLAIKDIFHQTVTIVRTAGIPDYERTNVGHGIGIEVHELPSLSPDQNGVLERDMVLNVETPYYCFGVGGFSCEDTVRITSEGYWLLTHLERQIRV